MQAALSDLRLQQPRQHETPWLHHHEQEGTQELLHHPWLEETSLEQFLSELPQPPLPHSKLQQAQQQVLHAAQHQMHAPEDSPSAMKGLQELRAMTTAQQVKVYARLLGQTERHAAADSTTAKEGSSTHAFPERLSASVLLCLHALELEAMHQGLLLADVSREELFHHLQTSRLPEEVPSSQASQQQERRESPTPLLLNPEWLQQQKEAVYGANPYPIPLRWKQTDLTSAPPRQPQTREARQHLEMLPSSSSVDEAPCVLRRRQVIIEGCIWRRLTVEVQQQLQQLAAAGRGSDSGPAKRLWIPWEGGPAAPSAAAPAAEFEGTEACLPQQLDPLLLAVIAARTVLQQLLLPKATAPTGPVSKGREVSACASVAAVAVHAGASNGVAAAERGGPELQQRQARVTQIAMAIGDAVHAEVAAGFLEGLQQQHQQQLGQCYLPLRKPQQPKRQHSSSSSTPAGAATPVMVPRWPSRRRLEVGGLLLQLLLKHAMIEAPYAVAKEELASELQQQRAEQQRIRLSQRRKQLQQQKLEEEHRQGATAAESGGLETAEQIVASREAQAAAAAAAAAEESAAVAAELTADSTPADSEVFVPVRGRTADELHHMVAYKSRHGHDKVSKRQPPAPLTTAASLLALPYGLLGRTEGLKRRKKFGVIEMRRLCFDRLTAVGGALEEAAATACAVAAAAAAREAPGAACSTSSLAAASDQATAAAAACPSGSSLQGVATAGDRGPAGKSARLDRGTDAAAAEAAAVAAAASASVSTAADRLSSPFWLMLKHVPMIVSPTPWTSYGSGGYLMLRTAFQETRVKSERPSFLLKLQTAENFALSSALYFPHNIDFRGRCYPLPPHLNHMGDDVSRSLLRFARGRQLGDSGWRWLRIHLANLFGKNKIDFDARCAWTDSRMQQILAAAQQPLQHKAFWLAADEPWQALAAIMETAAAVASGDPTTFCSKLPVHLDGTCNGLQHYAALGRDLRGGAAVNLVPADTPHDVYSLVLHVRSVVKQTVMTVCYGVTALGARDQVLSQLEDLLGGRVGPQVLRDMGGFLSRIVLQSIGELFRGAMQTKKWLDTVSSVCTAAGVPVAWEVPAIGLLCEQPYRSLQQQQIRSALQRHTLHVSGDSAPISRSKQRLGFPPNFIHSLDAAHMMLTALECIGSRKIDMAAVHDSYWAHAGSIDCLASALRQQFVSLYQHDPLQMLYDSVKQRLPKQAAELPPPPTKGNLDLQLFHGCRYGLQAAVKVSRLLSLFSPSPPPFLVRALLAACSAKANLDDCVVPLTLDPPSTPSDKEEYLLVYLHKPGICMGILCVVPHDVLLSSFSVSCAALFWWATFSNGDVVLACQ
ncbi:DNA-dependent rna [Cyclospora cayetanensis]|uniref:DNA-directed RNA polymerase n=1 Tax=Cyclospora cayetanensis TaxID=88456 RepID=A0A1D3CVT0_9EIME|nr:DNA-dependent rna [Cyclospora cayetanensis]